MQRLAVAAGLHTLHENVLRGHERQLLLHMRADDVGPHDEATGHVQRHREDDVRGEEGLGQHDATDGAVVERSLEPLAGVGLGKVLGQAHDVPRQRADALAAHGVALVGHGGGADLVLAEGLFHFLQVGQEANVARHLVEGGGDARQYRQDVVVRLAGVCLAAHGDRALEAHQFTDTLVQGDDLVVVSVEQLHEGGLRAGGALHAAEGDVLDLVFQILEVHDQILVPQRRSLANGHELSRLVVGEAESGQITVLVGEVAESVDDTHQLIQNQVRGLANLDQVGIITHIARSSTQVNNGHGLGAELTKSMDVGHHIMSQLLLLRFGELVVNVVNVCLHFRDLLVSNVEAQLLFSRSKGNPELSPGGKFHIRGPHIAHFLGGISLNHTLSSNPHLSTRGF